MRPKLHVLDLALPGHTLDHPQDPVAAPGVIFTRCPGTPLRGPEKWIENLMDRAEPGLPARLPRLLQPQVHA
jgi:hypothetical protein